MRMNVYAEELTDDIQIVEKTATTGAKFIGVRFFLESPKQLHHTDDDDDRSAVTFWVRSSAKGFHQGDEKLLKFILGKASWMLEQHVQMLEERERRKNVNGMKSHE